MGVDGSGPLGRATLIDRAGGGDTHRVGVLRLEWCDGGHEYGVVADGARQASDPLLPCGQAGLPEIPQGAPGVRAEPKGGIGAAGAILRGQLR